MVTEVLKNGIVTITPQKGIKDVTLHSSSRRLAPHHRFTKEELPPARPEMHISPLQIISSRNY